MSLIIYQMAHSPFCIPITLALRACNVPFQTKEVPNWDRREIIQLTAGAYYQVPVLVDGEQVVHETAADSQDVARFVDRTYAGGRLFPEHLDGLQEIVIDYLEEQVEAQTFRLVDPQYLRAIPDLGERTMVVRHKERRFGRGCVEAWEQGAAGIRAEADRLLARFEKTLRHSPFLFDDVPVYSDFLLFGILGNLTWNGWNELHQGSQKALIDWRERMERFRFPDLS